jgi:hypothetical protein
MLKKTRLPTTIASIIASVAVAALGAVGGLGQQIAFAELLDLDELFDEINEEISDTCGKLEPRVRGFCQAIPVIGPG